VALALVPEAVVFAFVAGVEPLVGLYAAFMVGLLAAIFGVMFIVVLGTFEWSSLRIIRKIPMTDAFVLVLVSAVTVATDLAMAVIVGMIVSALAFAWEHASHIHVKGYVDANGSRVYELIGPLFFGSVKNFHDLFTPEDDLDPRAIE
jgi:SulP family sulfate permease